MSDELAPAIHLALRENAYDFVNAAILEAEAAEDDPVHWKFAIVHVAQALELILKARLAQEHELLIRQNVDKVNRLTVGFDLAIARLGECGVQIEDSWLRKLRAARDLRNDIVHYAVNTTSDELRAAFVSLFEFAHRFHLRYLGEELHGHIDEEQREGEAWLMQAFEERFTMYQGAEILATFAAEIVAAQYDTEVMINGQRYERIRFGAPNDLLSASGHCHNCAVVPGQLHVLLCCGERCPRCKGSALGCNCEWEDIDDQQPAAESA